MSMREQERGSIRAIPTGRTHSPLSEMDVSRHGQENAPSRLDSRLDAALEHTFPASDPVAILICVKQAEGRQECSVPGFGSLEMCSPDRGRTTYRLGCV